MQYLVTAKEMKEYDRFTTEQIGIPGMVLMERAALGAFQVLKERGLVREGNTAFLLAGYGNNGGDGLALARLLCEAGLCVELGLVGEEGKATESFARQRKILESFPVTTGKEASRKAYDIIVDALFGVGLSRALEGIYAQAVESLNALGGFKLALDVPSGISSDDGEMLGTAFRADMTVTFGFPKRGLFFYPGCEYAGEVRAADVGIGQRAFACGEPGMFTLGDLSLEQLFPRRDKAGNKGTFGKALLIAGSSQMAGAAILAGEACYRSGAGMVRILSAPDNRVILQERLPEALYGTYDQLEEALAWCDVICIGPGLGKSGEALSLLGSVLTGEGLQSLLKERLLQMPLVIDADGINLLAANPELLKALAEQGRAGREILLTPHMGELKRLYGALCKAEDPPDMQALKRHVPEYAGRIARELSAVVAAKDARTLICRESGPACLNTAGNNGMATAGSGDVLAGIVTGLMAQGESAFDAACKGVRIHALAGERAAERFGLHGLIAGDLCRQW